MSLFQKKVEYPFNVFAHTVILILGELLYTQYRSPLSTIHIVTFLYCDTIYCYTLNVWYKQK